MGSRTLFASVGALLIVLVIATEPFTQQILSYPTLKSNASNLTASIGATYVYDSGYHGDIDGTHSPNSKAQSLDMANAGIVGVYNSPVPSNHSCPSAVCEWPAFDSLGFCSPCEDISEKMNMTCTDDEGFCTYIAPTGIEFWTLWFRSSHIDIGLPILTNGYHPTTTLNISMQQYFMLHYPVTIAQNGQIMNVATFRLPQTCSSRPSQQECLPQVTQCSLELCVKTYSATHVEGGALKDGPTGTSQLDVDIESCSKSGPEGRPVTNLCPARKVNASGEAPSSQGSDKTYWLNNADVYDFALEFNSVFWGEQLQVPSEVGKDDAFRVNQTVLSQMPSRSNASKQELALYFQGYNQGIFGTGPLQAMYFANDGNTSKTWENIATSMTNQLRQNENATTVTDAVTLPVARIHVNWSWLIYPASLSLLAAALLVVPILSSLKRDRMTWKSSTLLLLFHGLQGWDAKELEGLDEIEMEKTSKGMWVRLSEDDSGRMLFKRTPHV